MSVQSAELINIYYYLKVLCIFFANCNSDTSIFMTVF